MDNKVDNRSPIISHPTIYDRRLEDKKKELLVKLIELVEDSYHRSDLTIDWLATQLSLSTRSFNRKCKACFQTTPQKFLNECRLNEAIRLIDDGKTINNIAFEVGFSTHSSFGRSFKKRFGCSPSKYAKGTLSKKDQIANIPENG